MSTSPECLAQRYWREIRRGPRRKSKESVGPTPPPRNKTLIFSFRVFVADHLHASGAGMGLGGELLFLFYFILAFSSASILSSHSLLLHRRCVEGRFVQPSRPEPLGVTGLRQAIRTHTAMKMLHVTAHWQRG